MARGTLHFWWCGAKHWTCISCWSSAKRCSHTTTNNPALYPGSGCLLFICWLLLLLVKGQARFCYPGSGCLFFICWLLFVSLKAMQARFCYPGSGCLLFICWLLLLLFKGLARFCYPFWRVACIIPAQDNWVHNPLLYWTQHTLHSEPQPVLCCSKWSTHSDSWKNVGQL